MTAVDDDQAADMTDEEADVFRHRYREAREAGLIPEDALTFAGSSADVGELRKLAACGCPPHHIAAIVL